MAMNYYVEGALCKNGLGRIVFPQGQIECQSGPCVLEFAAYQGSTEVVSWTAIPNIFDQEEYLYIPGDDDTPYTILVRQ